MKTIILVSFIHDKRNRHPYTAQIKSNAFSNALEVPGKFDDIYQSIRAVEDFVLDNENYFP